MKNHMYRSLFVLPALIFILVSGTHFVSAAESEGVQIKPAVIQDKVNPGDLYQFAVTVTNIAPTTKIFYLTTQDITGLDDRGLPVFAPEGDVVGYALSSWVSLPKGPVTLKGGESREIPFSIRVPRQAAAGSHFGGIFFTSDAQGLKDTGSAVGMKIGTIISLKIAGDVTEEARLREFSTERLIYSTADIVFQSKVENLGNVLVRPHGLIEVTDMWGKKVASVMVNESGAPIFPTASRVFSTAWQYDGFAFGRYQAVLSLSYGDDSRKTISTVASFWILPLKVISMVLGGILLVIFALYMWVRLYIKRKVHEMGGSNSGGASDYYTRKYNKAGSRLFTVAIGAAVLCILFLGILFAMFA